MVELIVSSKIACFKFNIVEILVTCYPYNVMCQKIAALDEPIAQKLHPPICHLCLVEV